MDFRNVHVVHHQRIMRLCQYHGFYGHVKFWFGQCQHFPGGSAAWLSGQCHSDLEKPEKPGSEGIYPIVSYGTCGKYSWLLPIKKCGCQRHQGGVWSYDHSSGKRDVPAGTPSGQDEKF